MNSLGTAAVSCKRVRKDHACFEGPECVKEMERKAQVTKRSLFGFRAQDTIGLMLNLD